MNPSSYSRVVITGDLLRPYPVAEGWESATWKNIRWLHALLRPLLPTKAPAPTTLAWDARGLPGVCEPFDTPSLYHRLGEALSLRGWARLASLPQAPAALVDALREPLRDALVIGYEMPAVLIDALRQLDRPFIDLILHPVRFMPDLVFAMRTNVPACHAVLQRHTLSSTEVSRQAGLIQAKAAWMAPPAPLPPGTVLLLGQVATDRAMVQPDGRWASLGDHLTRLHQLCCEHPLVLFKPHPYDAPDSPMQAAVRRLPAIAHTQANYYHLLAQPEVQGVVALNSSGLIEARAFGRSAENLVPFLYDFDRADAPQDGQPGSPVALGPAWTEPAFWQALLLGEADTPVPAVWTPNRLRRSMNADWGYGFIDQITA